MQPFIYVFLSLLVIIGVCSLVKGLVLWIFKTDIKDNVYAVVMIDDRQAELTVRSAVENLKWNNFGLKRIAAVDCGISKENKEAVSLLPSDYQIPLLKEDEEIGDIANIWKGKLKE